MKNRISKLLIHMKVIEFTLSNFLMDFEAMTLYVLAMWVEKSVYPEFGTGFAFTHDMNDQIVEKFYTQTFTKVCAISEVLFYNLSEVIFHHLSVGKKLENLR